MTLPDNNKTNLIGLLRAMPPGQILSSAPKQYVMRGHDYYRRGLLKDLNWNDAGFIHASVLGTRLYSVDISAQDRRLITRCNCPAWNSYNNCKHVICSLMTLKNILDGSFGPPPNARKDEIFREILVGELIKQEPPSRKESGTGYAVAITQKGAGFDILVEYNGQKAMPFARGFPSDLLDLAVPFDAHTKCQALTALLRKKGAGYPMRSSAVRSLTTRWSITRWRFLQRSLTGFCPFCMKN